MTALIKEAYMVRDNVFMIIDQKGTAYWSDVPSKSPYKYSITENTLIMLVEYLIYR